VQSKTTRGQNKMMLLGNQAIEMKMTTFSLKIVGKATMEKPRPPLLGRWRHKQKNLHVCSYDHNNHMVELPHICGFNAAKTYHHVCCDVAVAQINYPILKHNTQDSIEQVRGQSHEEGLVQIFMLYDMQFGGVWKFSTLKQKKTKNYQAKVNKIKKLSREQTLVSSKHPSTEIRTDHGNETSIYTLNIYLFLY
jgi:hypothetical protein